jgi:hypothetical protein
MAGSSVDQYYSISEAMKLINQPSDDIHIQSVQKVTLLKYLVVIIRRCQMCNDHAGQQSEQFL